MSATLLASAAGSASSADPLSKVSPSVLRASGGSGTANFLAILAFPAATTGTIPAARTFCTASNSTPWVHCSSEMEQYQELLTATGALLGSGFFLPRSHGAIMNSKHVM